MKAILRFREKGPGRGWHGPPKGDHTSERVPGGEKAPKGPLDPDLFLESEHYTDRKDQPLERGGPELQGWSGDRLAIANSAIYNYNQGMDTVVLARQLSYGPADGIGTLSMTEWRDPYPGMKGKYREIVDFATRSRGFGRATMDEVLRHARADQAGVFLKSVPAAKGFYEAIGMRQGPEERQFYWTPEDVQGMAE